MYGHFSRIVSLKCVTSHVLTLTSATVLLPIWFCNCQTMFHAKIIHTAHKVFHVLVSDNCADCAKYSSTKFS